MRFIRYMVPVGVAMLTAGCTVQRGTVDFPNPWFDVHCGFLGLIAFPSSTVLRVGSTYLTLSMPVYVPLALIVVFIVALWIILRRREEHA
jgi:hypothetical protein